MHPIVTALGVARATAWTCGVDGEASRGVFCLAQRDGGCVKAGTETWPWARTAVSTTSSISNFAVFFVFVFFLGPVPAQLCYQHWTSVIKRILRHVRKPELSIPLPLLPGLTYKEPLARFPTGTQSELRAPEGRGSMRTCVVSVSWSCAGCAEGSAVASWKSNGYHVKRVGIPDSATLEGEARTSCFRMGRGKRDVFRVRRRGTQGDADESRRHLWEVADSITGRKHKRGVGADTPVMGLVATVSYGRTVSPYRQKVWGDGLNGGVNGKGEAKIDEG
ncbi:hypothetical protein V8E53_003695 [Lactarius tabidus]